MRCPQRVAFERNSAEDSPESFLGYSIQGGMRCPQRVRRKIIGFATFAKATARRGRSRSSFGGKAVSLTNARLSVEAAVPAATRDCAGDPPSPGFGVASTPATTAHCSPSGGELASLSREFPPKTLRTMGAAAASGAVSALEQASAGPLPSPSALEAAESQLALPLLSLSPLLSL